MLHFSTHRNYTEKNSTGDCMMYKKITTLALSLATLSLGSSLVAAAPLATESTILEKGHTQQFVKPAQVFASASDTITPTLNAPIHFSTIKLRDNIKVKHDKSVFEIEVPGRYDITSFMLVNPPNIGDSVTIAFLINGALIRNFIDQEIVTSDTIPMVTQRDVYLKKGDQVSVVLQNAPAGTTISNRGFSFVIYNNTK